MRGGFVRVLPGFDIEAFCRTVEAEKINTVLLVPTMIYALIDAKEVRARYDLSSLETIIYGAAPMSPDRLLEAMAIFGNVFVQFYGQTEVPQCITSAQKDRSRSGQPSPARLLRAFESAGRGEAVRFRHERSRSPANPGRSASAARS